MAKVAGIDPASGNDTAAVGRCDLMGADHIEQPFGYLRHVTIHATGSLGSSPMVGMLLYRIGRLILLVAL